MVRADCAACTHGFYANGVPELFLLPDNPGDRTLSKRSGYRFRWSAAEIFFLGGDDKLHGRVRDRICFLNLFSGRKPLLFPGGVALAAVARRPVRLVAWSHRAFWARAWRGLSLGTCGGIVRGFARCVALPAQDFLVLSAILRVHVCFDGLRAKS